MKIIKILSFILIAIVILALISIFIIDIKGCSKTKPEEVTTTDETKEPTLKEQTTQEPTEETEEISEEPTTKEEPIEETSTGEITYIDEAKHQGYVEDIDYENRIITIKNEITGEIEKLDNFSDYLSLAQSGILESKEFKDIKVGYYIFAMTEKEWGFDVYEIFGKDALVKPNPSGIFRIWFSEEKPKWVEEEK